MIGQLLGAVGNLASTYLEGKVAVQKANAEIKVKQACQLGISIPSVVL